MSRVVAKRLPRVPGQWWLKAWVESQNGTKCSRVAHALIHAPTAIEAAQDPICEMVRERLEAGLIPGTFFIHLNIEARRAEVIPHVN